MKKEWLVKSLALGVVVLFICTGVVSAFNVNQDDKSSMTMDNHPPDAPWIAGRHYIRPGIYEWTFEAFDPDGDDVSYQIFWGDGGGEEWVDWYPSGEKITRSHCYSVYGPVSISARAKDIYNATGEWGYLECIVSKNNQIINLAFIQFFNHFHYAFPILKYVVKLG